MAVTMICPNLKCRTILQVPEAARGRRVRCGKCAKTFLVPAAAPAKGNSQPATTDK